MSKPLYPSRRVQTVTVTNDRAVKLWLCPACLKPFTRPVDLARHLTQLHKLPPAHVATHMRDLVSVPARKTTVLHFEDPRPTRANENTSPAPLQQAAGAGHD